MSAVPVHVVTGFLGSGKTTLLNRLLASPGLRDTAVIVNEFGAIPLEASRIRYEAMVSSANKCIEGVPGFGFVIARKSELEAARGNSHSLSLDVHAQWATMETTGQWRFTPPTHVVAAFIEALKLHEAEGGVAARGARYARNRDVMVAGMRELAAAAESGLGSPAGRGHEGEAEEQGGEPAHHRHRHWTPP